MEEFDSWGFTVYDLTAGDSENPEYISRLFVGPMTRVNAEKLRDEAMALNFPVSDVMPLVSKAEFRLNWL